MITYGAKFLSDHRKSMQNMDFFLTVYFILAYLFTIVNTIIPIVNAITPIVDFLQLYRL